jgi:hypothetical protein
MYSSFFQTPTQTGDIVNNFASEGISHNSNDPYIYDQLTLVVNLTPCDGFDLNCDVF